ncbi:protein of unknown function [Ruminococcaceae bacterium BL-6]|nr:protein of unknown function [Ruminococcaceae bacterium BL-6]
MFVVSVVNVFPKTEDDIIKDYQNNHISYTIDEYKKWLKSWDLLDYKYECEQVGYYECYEPANYSVENNIADIRDHTYDYAMIYEIPMNCMYPYIYIRENNLYVFKFNKVSKKFEEVKNGFNNEVSFIFKKRGFTVY